jgi:hypothetical protein
MPSYIHLPFMTKYASHKDLLTVEMPQLIDGVAHCGFPTKITVVSLMGMQ